MNPSRNSVLTALVLLLAALAAAQAPGQKPEKPDPFLLARHSPEWLRLYSLSPYKEHWTLDVKVANLQKDMPKVLKVLEKAGAALTQPLAAFAASPDSQQLSCRLPLKSAKSALKGLKKIGAFSDPLVQPTAEPIDLSEVKGKIKRLMAERTAHAKELSGMPVIATLADELIEHLLMVESIREKQDTEVLLNMTLREKR